MLLTNRQETPEGPSAPQQQLRIVRADGPPLDSWIALDRWAARTFHSHFVAMRDEHGRVPSEGISDLRRRHREPWRTILRRVREVIVAGEADPAPIDGLPVVLREYIRAGRIIAANERAARPRAYATFRRAAAILVTLACAACAQTVAEPTPVRPITPKAPPSDTGAWVPTTPAVRP